ncbi:MAG TPA: type IV toxin-antitoxin system AbiEi family antitoxin [Blastocatellia bacterium]|nr:type IV toxin-antitoxin system AbiEi family antitoxin [Blastocatellia bacterium]
MITGLRSPLSSYITGLLSKGRVVFTREEAEKAVGVGRGPFLDAAEGLQHKGLLLTPRRGFYVVVPPQYLSWGAPPPAWYIDDLMKYLGRPYYIGLLKAAELRGATHQAVMEFQVVTDKRMPKTRAGRSVIAFYYRKDIASVRQGVDDRKTDTGTMKVSSPELTALDLVRYPHAAGGLDNIATVLADLADRMNPEKLAALAAVYERSVLQRVGYLLSTSGRDDLAGPLSDSLSCGSPLTWVELDPSEATDRDLTPEAIDRDDRWHVVVRRLPRIEG